MFVKNKIYIMKKIIILLLSCNFLLLNAQENNTEEYQFTSIVDVDETAVKSQGKTGTCWSFSTSSFIESEILRLTGKRVDLSEMYNARIVYPEKAKNFVGRQGKTQFSQGSLNHDVINVIRNYGLVPEADYQGKIVDKEKYNHAELAHVLKAYVSAIVDNKGGKLSTVWLAGYEAVLDTYLGAIPETFTFENKTYTPIQFRDEMKIKAEDYIEFTSFNAYPLNSKIILNIPDNWANGSYYNVSLSDYQKVVEDALNNGYSVALDIDVSEKYFSSFYGMAIVPEKEMSEMGKEERKKLFKNVVAEKKITPDYRQQEFNNQNTTDDHLMHITGMLKDQNGVLYFKVKNSWGTENLGNEGHIYVSEAFFQLKSIAVMVHKDAVSKAIKKKVNIQ